MYHPNTQNLQHHLWARESNWKDPGRHHPIPLRFLFHERNFYKSITPRLTVQNVDKPFGHLRKFTPDGQMLLAFSLDQRSLIVYQYKGIASAAPLLRQHEEECITAADHSLASLHIRHLIFFRLFNRKYSVPLITAPPTPRYFLNREFSLFLDNGRYVVLASTAGGSIFPSYQTHEQYPDLFDDAQLYDYTFFLVDLKRGCIADTLRLGNDFVMLSYNHSVSLYDRTLAILSTYRQCIDLIELNPLTGKLQRLYTVGPYGSDLDRDRILSHQLTSNYTFDPGYSLPLPHLIQKILSYRYREIMEATLVKERQQKLKDFYTNFGQVERMLISKMQLIDSDHLLLRYEKRQTQMPLEMNIGNSDPTNKNFILYVFYNVTEQKILKIYTKNSIQLLKMLRNYCDEFRNVHSLQIPWHASSPSNNEFFRAAFDVALNSFLGGLTEAAGRFNPTLPISSQSFSTSPYLDYSLFTYDDRFISTLERPRITSLEPIRFFDRNTGLIKFRIFLEPPPNSRNDTFEGISIPRDLVSFIFHPYEPFVISKQKFLSRYVVNFHMYNTRTKIKT